MMKHRSTTNINNKDNHGNNSSTTSSQLLLENSSSSATSRPNVSRPRKTTSTTRRNIVVILLGASLVFILVIISVSYVTFLPTVSQELPPKQFKAFLSLSSPPQQHVQNPTKAVSLSPTPTSTMTTTAITITATSTTVEKLWHSPNSTLPQWMKDYFDWHVVNRAQLQEEEQQHWRSHRYLILVCHEGERCGGVSDRLKPLPFLLWLAYQSKRLLLIHWSNRPFGLEEFVVPHVNGINWTTPRWLWDQRGPKLYTIRGLVKGYQAANVSMIYCKIQTWDGGREYYEQHVQPPSTYAQVFAQVFATFFTPSPAISHRLQHIMQALRLHPGQYVVAHHRANYQHKQANHTHVVLASINAVNCASTMWPGVPIYYCSDSQESKQIVQEYANTLVLSSTKEETSSSSSRRQMQQQQLQPPYDSRIVVRDADHDAIHLDKANKNHTLAEGFYDIFVDLYLMVHAQCVAYGPGGFGRFGMLLSRNASCGLRHFYHKQLAPCQWTPL